MHSVLITGGAGFIGSHLAEYLLERDLRVHVLDDLSTGRFRNIQHLIGRSGFRHFIGSVDAPDLLAEAASGCDVIYHLAAAVGVKLIVRDPIGTIERNINGTEVVLKYAVRYSKPVLITSTSEVYGKGMKIPFREDDDVVYGPTSRPRWAYAVSKSVDEFLLRAYCQTKGLPGVIARLFNTVGPRQLGEYGMVIPRFVEQALNGGPIIVYGDGTQRRCFTHVADIVRGLYDLMRIKQLNGQVVNLGNPEPISIRSLAEKVRDLVNPELEILHISYESAYGLGFEDMQERQPDLTRAKELIAFQPAFNLDKILEDVIIAQRSKLRETQASATAGELA